MNKIIRFDDITNLFFNITMAYELDKFEYENLNFENEEDVDDLIQKYIVSRYNQLDGNQVEWLRDSLSYFITYEPERLASLNVEGYLPFEIPENPKPFFMKIWQKIFGNSNYIFIGKPEKIIY